ncbi:MAG: alpha/beta fold hydrolase [Beutenbergiaceae bacterium]
MRARRTFIAALAGALLLTGASAASAEPEAVQVNAPVPVIEWGPCEGEGSEELAAFECASVEVPRDYDRPQGKTTSIALTRLPATSASQRTGSLFVNFGGPGGPGVAGLHGWGYFLDPRVHARFDVIGFDPRGVGQSDPITCFPDAASEAAFMQNRGAFPLTAAQETAYIRSTRVLANACQLFSGDRIRHASTANVARDMDLLRQAVGDEQLSYIGYSYGTVLGATYAALFPQRVRALVLDGTVDPEVWSGGPGSIGQRTGGWAGAEAFDQFLALCAQAGGEACALAALGEPKQLVDALFERLQEAPIDVPLPDGSSVSVPYDFVVANSFGSMYAPAGWPDLAAFLALLVVASSPQQANDALSLQSRAGGKSIGELLRERGLIEDYPGSIGGFMGATCTDGRHPLKPWEYQAQADEADAEAPHFGRYRSWLGLECEFVNFRDRDAYRGPWQQTTDAPVMVIGTRYDPSTAYEFTRPYADHFPDARMMTVEGYGHTTAGISTCANVAIGTYLIDLEATDGAVCGQDFAPFDPLPGDVGAEQLMLAPQVPALW